MPQTTPIRLLAGAFLGAAVTGLALTALPRRAPGAVAPTAIAAPPATRPETAPFVAPGETIVGNTSLLPTALRIDGDTVIFEYDLVPLASNRSADIYRQSWGPTPGAVPEHWTLVTTSGDRIETRLLSDLARTVRFTVPSSFRLDDVAGLEITAWRMRFSADLVRDLDLRQPNPVVLPDLRSVVLRRTLEPTTGAVAQFRVEPAPEPFGSRVQGRRADISLWSPAPAWNGDYGRLAGDLNAQLTFTGDLPDPLPLGVSWSGWVQIPSEIEVDLGRLSHG